jgi:hypothetical protein
MASMILLLVIAGSLWAGWILMRRVARMPARRVWGVVGILLLLILLELAQRVTGCVLAIPGSSSYTPASAGIAGILLLFLLWHKSRIAGSIAFAILFAVPFILLLHFGRGLVVLLIVWLGTGGGWLPPASGRVTPAISYEVENETGLIGDSRFNVDVFYRNPGWFPLIHKEFASEREQCYDPEYEPGAAPDTVRITCSGRNGEPISVVVPQH